MKKINSSVRLIQSLEASQLLQLSGMVNANILGLNATIRTLYQVVISEEIDLANDDAVWAKVHPGRPLNAGSLRKLYSDLNGAVQTCLALLAVLEKEEWSEFMKYQAGTNESRDLLLQKWKKSLVKLGLGDGKSPRFGQKTDHFFVGHQIFQEKYSQEIRLRKDSGFLEQSMDCLDKYYILKKLKFMCEAKLNSTILIQPHNKRLSKEIWLQAQQAEFQAIPLIAVYSQILTLLNSLENFQGKASAIKSSYLELKSYLNLHLSSIAPDEIRDLLNLCQNICMAMGRTVQFSTKDELEDFFRLRLQTNTFLVNGHVLPEEFKNRVSFLLIHNQIPEARSFLNEFKPYLQQRFYNDVYFFSLGSIQFYEGDFPGMRRSFQEVNGDDPFFILDLKSLSIKALFFENDPIPLLNGLEALKRFIGRHTKLKHSRLKMHQYRLNAFQRLYRLLYGARQSPKQLRELQAVLDRYSTASDQTFWKEMVNRAQMVVKK